MAAAITAVSPTSGALTGGTTLTVSGSGLSRCDGNVYVRPAQGSVWQLTAKTITDAALTAVTVNMTGHGGPCDVGVYDNTSLVWVWSAGAFYAGTPPAGDPTGRWDYSVWDGGHWQQRRFAPGAGWGYDWQVWYQYAGAIVWDMTDATVEVRWTTDSHTTGDGTYRGDVQPGTLALQLHDPTHVAETLDKRGTIWLHYGPSNFTWGFYVDTVTRQLVAPGDNTAADVVIQGSVWPLRLSSDCLYQFSRPAERADTRLGAIAAFLSQNANLALPRYDSAIAAQSQTVQPTAPVDWDVGHNAYPSALSLIRDAAANGVAWVSGTVDGAGLGHFVLNYARWEVGTRRNLAASDIVAGIPYDASMDDILTQFEWDGTAPSGTATKTTGVAATVWQYGYVKASMRLWADLINDAASVNAATLTASALMVARGDPTVSKLSAVTATSGERLTPAGAASTPWNSAAHVWTPADILHWVPPTGTAPTWKTDYRVTKTDHRLRAAAWDSAHTVELWAAATALPA